jgi:OOP family OmpA-OmpF porin
MAFSKTVFCVGMSLLLMSCAGTQQKVAFDPMDLNPKLQSGEYVQKVDNLLLIMDVSGSMVQTYKGRIKLNDVKDIVSRLNQTIPDLKLDSGLRRFGKGTFASAEPIALMVDLDGRDKAEISNALKKISSASGESLLDVALDAAITDLQNTQGEIAVIVISDGDGMDSSPIESAKALKRHYGGRLCIYTVLIGNDPDGKKLMEDITEAGACGFSVLADDIVSSEGMAGFVEKVFLAKAGDIDGDGVLDTLDRCPNTTRGARVDASGCALDSDLDAVFDGLDSCPGTPKGVMVDPMGCPLDSDGDGVEDHIDRCRGTAKGVDVDSAGCPLDSDGDFIYDYLDKCPGTPKDAAVDERGCWVLKGVYFDLDKWELKSAAYPVLDEVVFVLKRNPNLRVEIQGHTDNIGEAQYNRELSKKRARSVMGYFIEAGIEPGRLSYEGYGFSSPAASNATREGRAKNRRVELKPIY